MTYHQFSNDLGEPYGSFEVFFTCGSFEPDGPEGFESNRTPAGPDYASSAVAQYLNYRKTSIYGGSNEIQKNIIAKAILGV
mgnify:CR=1 FL=1